MAKDAEKRKDKLYNVLALLLMLALFGCGVWGVVESRIAKRDYKNSPDVRQVSAVVSSYRTIESKDDDGDVISTGENPRGCPPGRPCSSPWGSGTPPP